MGRRGWAVGKAIDLRVSSCERRVRRVRYRLHIFAAFDAELFDFRVERGAFEAEAFSSAVGTADHAFGFAERTENMVALGSLKRGV